MQTLYTPKEVSEILKINKDTLLRFLREKRLKSVKIGREYRIREQDLQSFIDNPQGYTQA